MCTRYLVSLGNWSLLYLYWFFINLRLILVFFTDRINSIFIFIFLKSETFEAPSSVNNLSGNSLQESLDIEVDQLTQNLDSSLVEDSEETNRKLVEDDGSLQSSNVSRRLQMTTADNRSLQSNTDNNMGSLVGVDSLAVMNVCQSLDREVESAVNRPNIIRSSMRFTFCLTLQFFIHYNCLQEHCMFELFSKLSYWNKKKLFSTQICLIVAVIYKKIHILYEC